MVHYKLIFYVPKENTEDVKSAIFATGAGQVGHYSNCSWQVLGDGQFKPLDGAKPHIGEIDKVKNVEEYRVEILCTDNNIQNALMALKESHPYEEPAYEIISIENHLFT